MAMYSDGKMNYGNCRLLLDKWYIGGCPVTYQNVNHPLIQKFFNNMGAKIKQHNGNGLLVTGRILMAGPDLHNFLMQQGINLKEKPSALDVEPPPKANQSNIEIKRAPALTPAFNKAKAIKAERPEEEACSTPDKTQSTLSWLRSYLPI